MALDDAAEEQLVEGDDLEMQQYLLSPEEEKLKTMIWEKMNEDWISEQQEKATARSQK